MLLAAVVLAVGAATGRGDAGAGYGETLELGLALEEGSAEAEIGPP
jgi:hypothetical protein